MGAIVIAVLGLLLMGSPDGSASRQHWMHPLELPDEAFRSGSPDAEDAIGAWADSLGVAGLVLDGARHTDGEEPIALVGAFVRTLREDIADPIENAVLLIWSHEQQELTQIPAFPSPKMPVKKAPPKGFDPGEGMVTSTFSIAARPALGTAWEPGHYRVWMLVAGRVSNPVAFAAGEVTAEAEDRAPRPPGSVVLKNGDSGPELGLSMESGDSDRVQEMELSIAFAFQRPAGAGVRIWSDVFKFDPALGDAQRIAVNLPEGVDRGWLMGVARGQLMGPMVLGTPGATLD